MFNAETGQLSVRDETQLSPRRQKFKNKLLSASPLVSQGQEAESELHASEGTRSELEIEESKGRVPQTDDSKRQEDPGPENLKLALPGKFTSSNWCSIKKYHILYLTTFGSQNVQIMQRFPESVMEFLQIKDFAHCVILDTGEQL